MSINTLHPALYANAGYHLVSGDNGNLPEGELGRHFVAEGWEEVDRGICPCGEVVRWDEAAEVWVPDRDLRVLVLTKEEVETLWSLSDHDLSETINRQLHYNEPFDDSEPPADPLGVTRAALCNASFMAGAACELPEGHEGSHWTGHP